MQKQILLGGLTFNSKKEALNHFKKILNSYEFGEILNIDDFNDVCELLKKHDNYIEKIGSGIKEITVMSAKYGTRCFYLVRNDSSLEQFSYIKCINGGLAPIGKFSCACRESVSDDLVAVKKEFFKTNSKDGKVKCQETGDLCSWTELNIDHRQPNTFSVIVDRFIEINHIDIGTINYDEEVDGIYTFKDKEIADRFRNYHKEKANLRIVRKDKNLSRSSQGRIKRQKKDLMVK